MPAESLLGGIALESTQQELLAELRGKLAPADLAVVAQETTLAALRDRLPTALEADDGSIAPAASALRAVGLGYGWNGDTSLWERQPVLSVDAAGALRVVTGVPWLPDASIPGGTWAPAAIGLNLAWDSDSWERMTLAAGRLRVEGQYATGGDGSMIVTPNVSFAVDDDDLPADAGALRQTVIGLGYAWDASRNAGAGGWRRLRVDSSGQLLMKSWVGQLPSAVTADDRLKVETEGVDDAIQDGTITANGQSVTMALPRNAGVLTFAVRGAVNFAAIFELSFNSGTTWIQTQTARNDVSGNPSGTATINIGAGAMMVFEAQVPPGATHARLRATAFTSGSAAVRIAASRTQAAPVVHVSGTPAVNPGGGALASGTNRIGGVNPAGVWWDDSSTPLAAAGTWTGTGRDLIGVTSGTAGLAWHSVRGLAASNVAGTLHLEVSRDNATWRRIRSAALEDRGGGTFAAEVKYEPAVRYYRWAFTNGAGAQSWFLVQTMQT